jgi:hypothetical protein
MYGLASESHDARYAWARQVDVEEADALARPRQAESQLAGHCALSDTTFAGEHQQLVLDLVQSARSRRHAECALGNGNCKNDGGSGSRHFAAAARLQSR